MGEKGWANGRRRSSAGAEVGPWGPVSDGIMKPRSHTVSTPYDRSPLTGAGDGRAPNGSAAADGQWSGDGHGAGGHQEHGYDPQDPARLALRMLATARTVEPARAMALGLTTGPQLVGGSAGLTMTGVSPGMMGGAGGLREGAYGLSPAMGGRLGDQP